MNSKVTVALCLLIVVSCADRQGIFNAFSFTGFDFSKKLNTDPQVLRYSLTSTITKEAEKTYEQKARYMFNVYPVVDPERKEANTYYGWLDSFVDGQGKETRFDYTAESQEAMPVFKFTEDARTGDVTSITSPVDLTSDLKRFVGLAFDQVSPSVSAPEVFKVNNDDRGSTVIAAQMADKNVAENGKISQSIRLGQDNFIEQSEVGYAFRMPCFGESFAAKEAKDPCPATQEESMQKVELQGDCENPTDFKTETKLNLESRDPASKTPIDFIRKYLEGGVVKTETLSRQDFEDRLSREFEAQVTETAQASTFETSTTEITQTGKRLLPVVYPIFSKTQTLITQNIFGKTLKIQLHTVCTMTVYTSSNNPNNKIYCSGDAIVSYGSKTKTFHLFDFTKSLINWSKNTAIVGGWGIGAVIPLPPPVSFVQIAINLNIGYSFGVGAYIQFSGIQVKAGAYAEAALTVSANAGVRLLIVEAGAYITGKIVSLRVEPRVVANLLLGKIQGFAETKLKLNAFSFKWGLYYKWCYIFGCGSLHTITTWNITQGVTATWTIFYLPFTIYL